MTNELRFELDYIGNVVEKETELCSDLDGLVTKLFSQNGWVYNENEKSGSTYRNIVLTNASGNKYEIHVYAGTIRNEKRSPYEKKIQLSGKDPRAHKGQDTIIIGVYVFHANDNLKDAIIVGYPIDKSVQYDTNPSLRGVFVDKILQQAKLKGFAVDTQKKLIGFRPEFIFYYLDNYMQIHYGENAPLRFIKNKHLTKIHSEFERNRIIFGAPGTGKSYTLKNDCSKLMDDTFGTYERVTFHPDYSYTHFVGSYKPVSEETVDSDGNRRSEIKYEFVPGPFLRIYVDALKSGQTNTPQPHLLLIEEINRAKMASVFGEVFQLLDRDSDGVSEYEICTTEDIRKYLAKQLNAEPDDFDRIQIPDNMFIWATMNSADQGVFPMDTAFKRRWHFEYIGINNNDDSIRGKIKLGKGAHEFEVDCNRLRRAINDKLSTDYKINEDKLLGPFFLSKQVLRINEFDGTIADPEKFIDEFKSKILMYLYEDAAKQHKHKLFSRCDSSKYSSVCDAFDEVGIDIFEDGFREFYNQQKD
jgi:hypothetical protein